MVKFIYNNAIKNTSISHILFELNYGYYLHIFFEKNIDLYSNLKIVDKLIAKVQELLTVCHQNFEHT